MSVVSSPISPYIAFLRELRPSLPPQPTGTFWNDSCLREASQVNNLLAIVIRLLAEAEGYTLLEPWSQHTFALREGIAYLQARRRDFLGDPRDAMFDDLLLRLQDVLRGINPHPIVIRGSQYPVGTILPRGG